MVLLLAAGCVFVQCRKRRTRRVGRGVNPELSRRARKKGHRPDSSLSFRCQTHLTPKTPTFFPIEEEAAAAADDARDEKRRHAAASSSPAPPVSSRWMSPEALYSYRNSPAPAPADRKAPLASITTSLPMVPVKSHSPRFSSPQDDYTPSSTTSAAPLLPLRHYVPAEHGAATPSLGHHAFSPATAYSSPTSGHTASPLLSQAGWPAPVARPVQIDNLPATEPGRTWNIRPLPRRVTSLGGGSPVESHKIQTSFPPPPPPKKR